MSIKYIVSLIMLSFMVGNLTGCTNAPSKPNSITLVPSNVHYEVVKPQSNDPEDQQNKNDTIIKAENKAPTIIKEETEKTDLKDTNNSMENPVKLKNKVIVIDAGHGGTATSETEPISPGSKTMKAKDVSGASGVVTGNSEYAINLDVSLKLKDYLIKDGYTVIMTRTSNSQSIGNIARAEIGNKNNANLVIRVHADSSTNNSAKGASMLVPGDVGYAKDISAISEKYGEIILNTLLNQVGMKNRGVIIRTDLTGFNWSKVPSVLIEMGFLSNPDEDRLLSSNSYQDKIAQGLFNGIKKALGD